MWWCHPKLGGIEVFGVPLTIDGDRLADQSILLDILH